MSFLEKKKPKASNTNDHGKQENRRVDIIIYHTIPRVIIVDAPPKDLCKEDTIIRLDNGTEFVFNKCEYMEQKDCLELTEITNVNDAIANGMTTTDEDENPLVSGGMLGFNPIQTKNCDNICFKNPIVVRFLIAESPLCRPCGRSAQLYNIDKNGNWTLTKEELEIVEINNLRFYELTLPPCWNGFKKR